MTAERTICEEKVLFTSFCSHAAQVELSTYEFEHFDIFLNLNWSTTEALDEAETNDICYQFVFYLKPFWDLQIFIKNHGST